jgi:hypothetical protein
MTDLAWMLVVQIPLLWVLDYLLVNSGTRGRQPNTSRPATAPLSEQTAQCMIERAYASTIYQGDSGVG